MPGQAQVGLSVIAMGTRIQHAAACPEISPTHCAEQDLPDHVHDQQISWLRVVPQLGVGLGKGWQLGLQVPVDTKVMGIEYRLEDGSPYDPPYAGNHHRDEVLFGLADPTLSVRRYAGLGPILAGAHLGVQLPLGRIEENPFALAAEGLAHQHFQMGTGTVVPEGGLEVVLARHRWMALSHASLRLPLYENRLGYQPGTSMAWGLGVGWRVTPRLQWVGALEGTHQGQDAWDGDVSPTSGRHALALANLVSLNLSETWSLGAGLRTTVWQVTLAESDEDQFLQRFVGSVSVTRVIGSGQHEHVP